LQYEEYNNCPGLQAKLNAIKADNATYPTREDKDRAMSKCLSDPSSCPLGTRHPPHGIEFGMGCGLCRDAEAKKENDDAEARATKFASLLFDEKQVDVGVASSVLGGDSHRMSVDKTGGILTIPAPSSASAVRPWRFARSRGDKAEAAAWFARDFFAEFFIGGDVSAGAAAASVCIGLVPADARLSDLAAVRGSHNDDDVKEAPGHESALSSPPSPPPQHVVGYLGSGRACMRGAELASQHFCAEAFGVGDRIGVAFDSTCKAAQFYRNGIAQGGALTIAGPSFLCIGIRNQSCNVSESGASSASVATAAAAAAADHEKRNRAGIVMLPGRLKFADTLYCGRRLGRQAIPGSDGQCGPTNGPQCDDCKAGPVVAAPVPAHIAGAIRVKLSFAPQAYHRDLAHGSGNPLPMEIDAAEELAEASSSSSSSASSSSSESRIHFADDCDHDDGNNDDAAVFASPHRSFDLDAAARELLRRKQQHPAAAAVAAAVAAADAGAGPEEAGAILFEARLRGDRAIDIANARNAANAAAAAANRNIEVEPLPVVGGLRLVRGASDVDLVLYARLMRPLTGPLRSCRVTCASIRDQGYGDQKGHIYLRLAQPDGSVAMATTVDLLGGALIPHGEREINLSLPIDSPLMRESRAGCHLEVWLLIGKDKNVRLRDLHVNAECDAPADGEKEEAAVIVEASAAAAVAAGKVEAVSDASSVKDEFAAEQATVDQPRPRLPIARLCIPSARGLRITTGSASLTALAAADKPSVSPPVPRGLGAYTVLFEMRVRTPVPADRQLVLFQPSESRACQVAVTSSGMLCLSGLELHPRFNAFTRFPCGISLPSIAQAPSRLPTSMRAPPRFSPAAGT
jgi:hypothetical protein